MTDAELAILSIVAEGPIHGHDIQTVIANRGLRSWTNIGTSSIYYVLEKLERQGLLESTGERSAHGPARRQYRMTAAGYGVLQTAVVDLLSTPREYSNGFELGLANLHVLHPAQIRTAFAAYQQELQSRLGQMRARRDQLADQNAPFNVTAMFERSITLLEAELAWLSDFVDTWEAQAPPDEAVPPPAPVDIPRMKQVVLPHDPDSPHRVPTRPLAPPQAHGHVDSEAETDRALDGLGQNETIASASTPPQMAPPAPSPDSVQPAAREDTNDAPPSDPFRADDDPA